MSEIVIAGAGSVSPAGTGSEELLRSLEDKRSYIGRITKFSCLSEDFFGGEITDHFSEEYIKDKRFRRIADISKYAVTSASLALRDASLDPKEFAPERI